MERHLTTHPSPKPHLCNICGKGFARKDNLKEHRLSVHPGVVGGSEGNVTNPTTHEDILIRRSAATNVSVDGAKGATKEPLHHLPTHPCLWRRRNFLPLCDPLPASG